MHRFLKRFVSACIRALSQERRTERLLARYSTISEIKPHAIAHTPFRIYSLGNYHTPLWRALIHEIKSHKNMHAVSLISTHVSEALLYVLRETNASYIIPMPVHARKVRARGFNHVSLVLTHCSDDVRSHLCEGVLLRAKERSQQKTLSRIDRARNVAGCFAVRDEPTHTIVGKHLILVDDVCATGETSREAARTLMLSGATSVTVVCFCSA